MDLNHPTDCILGCAARVLCKRPSLLLFCSAIAGEANFGSLSGGEKRDSNSHELAPPPCNYHN